MSKYRPRKVKIQHHVIHGAEEVLGKIASYDEVDGIIPGVIRKKHGPSTGLTLQYPTDSGLKLLFRSSGAAQEVFVITGKRDVVTERLAADGLIRGES